MKVRPILAILFVIGLLIMAFPLAATHIRSADIKIEVDCANPRRVTITVIAYLNTLSNTRFGTNSQVLFGDGNGVRIPITTATLRPDLGTNIALATFTTTYTYATDGQYTVAYVERDRSTGILNIANSLDVPYVTFVSFIIDSNKRCNNIPILAVPPLDRACFKSTFFHTSGAYDIDGDSLSYELTVPANSPSTFANYTPPNDSRFYTNFNQGNEAGNARPTFSINPVSGLLTWDAPGTLGEYNIAFNIVEWRKDSVTNTYKKMSTTTRDMQIVVEECANIRPELTVPTDICVEAGTLVEGLIKGIDGDKDRVKIEVFSELLELAGEKFPATYSPNPTDFTSSDPFAQLNFRWQTDCIHVRQQPYQVVFKITDSPPRGPKLVNFKIWNIRVVAPAPKWIAADIDLIKRFGKLTWENYVCANANKIQIYRKVDSYPYAPGNCNPGLPKFLGYNLLTEVPVTQTSYIDTNNNKGLVAGAKYCYRILAYFNAPAGTPSIVSTEICIGPIEADAPIITHVSVEKTDVKNGENRISWRSPFNISTNQFPKPYEYEIYRASGFVGESQLVKVGRVTDTTFVEKQINTHDSVYNYRVVLYAKPTGTTEYIPVDTSATASSERLTFTSGVKKIELMWRDSVPWSNVVQQRPYHLIFRSIESTNENEMELIDSVKVTENGFYYVDEGKYKNQPLQDDKRYSYRIRTRGTYGNPDIALQENYSQVITAYPLSNILPCELAVNIHTTNCEDYLQANTCYQKDFSNTLSWKGKDLSGCRRDFVAYKILAASAEDGEYSEIAIINGDTTFTESGLPSFARCYRVLAIDGKGQEGPLSEVACNDNCPYFELPNVFTPNEDGFNDTFSSNFDIEKISAGTNENGLIIRCPRFVKQVKFQVYNRWGKEVYSLHTTQEDLLTIEWNGFDNSGHELTSGIYYFTAKVTFHTLRADNREKEFQGWVHLVK